ncbi:D-ribose pyranase [Natronospirillum operosum]|uniref:D-ribose pyranase n=1 Tax=Natronospirillum operosum TaxID=2759953 RepID=A0A4Z0WCW3_9GAMM|nr:D-ribose pyranase [Natronospirillum operosum]TGG92424.1 D-ribose pyranase [Natronospirillum operosum]
MKYQKLLNSELSRVIARQGHMDELTLGDAGLPVPDAVSRIDLAVIPGLPGLLDVLDAVLSELTIEGVLLAEELKDQSPDFHAALCARLDALSEQSGQAVTRNYVSHGQFKERTRRSKAVIRTGEVTPFANIVLISGVAF